MDLDYLIFLQHLRELSGNVLNDFFLWATSLGEGLFCYLAAAALYWCVGKKYGFFLFFNLLCSGALAQILKVSCCVYRPWLRSEAIHPVPQALKAAGGFSFPSGHTMKAVSIWGGFGTLVWRRYRPLAWLCFGAVLLVAFSRNYLGVHTPQDVLTSLAIGAAMLYSAHVLLNVLEKRPHADKWIALGGTVFAAAVLIFMLNKKIFVPAGPDGKPLFDPFQYGFQVSGALAGFFIGWFCERRLVRMDETAGTPLQKIFRFCIGAFLLILLMTAGERLWARLLVRNGARFVAELVNMLYITCLFPLVLTCFGGRRQSPAIRNK